MEYLSKSKLLVSVTLITLFAAASAVAADDALLCSTLGVEAGAALSTFGGKGSLATGYCKKSDGSVYLVFQSNGAQATGLGAMAGLTLSQRQLSVRDLNRVGVRSSKDKERELTGAVIAGMGGGSDIDGKVHSYSADVGLGLISNIDLIAKAADTIAAHYNTDPLPPDTVYDHHGHYLLVKIYGPSEARNPRATALTQKAQSSATVAVTGQGSNPVSSGQAN